MELELPPGCFWVPSENSRHACMYGKYMQHIVYKLEVVWLLY
jgi:hypothetical protein